MGDFTHFDNKGGAKMVDVSEKDITCRRAVAAARVLINDNTFALIKSGGMKKGDVLQVARIAGIMGAKKTSELIPLCHPIFVDGIDLDLSLNEEELCVEIESSVSICAKTGVEMEAMTAVSVAALTVYDMCKAVDKTMEIGPVLLKEKSGGKSGHFVNSRAGKGENP